MVRKKKEEYELVPEEKFLEVAKKVDEFSKNPLLETKAAARMENLIEDVNDSIISLLDVMKVLSDDVAFDEKEKHLIKHEVKPLVLIVNEIKEQNETIANAMVNLIDRMNDMQKQITHIENFIKPPASHMVNSRLPPISGGPQSPVENNSSLNNFPPSINSSDNYPSNDSMPPGNLPPPPK